MAIVPLDLQVLYSQLETVSKRVAHEQQGTQLANAIQQEAHAQQMAEKNSTVQQLQSGEDGIQKVKDRASGGSSQGGSRKKQQEEGYRRDILRFCCFNVWYGSNEWRS